MENQIPFNEAMFTLASGPQTVWLYWMSFATCWASGIA